MAIEAKHKSSSFLNYFWKQKNKTPNKPKKPQQSGSCFPAPVFTFRPCSRLTSCPGETQMPSRSSLHPWTGKVNSPPAGPSKVPSLEDQGLGETGWGLGGWAVMPRDEHNSPARNRWRELCLSSLLLLGHVSVLQSDNGIRLWCLTLTQKYE